MWFTKTFEVAPNTEGFLFKNHVLKEKLAPGRYKYSNWDDAYQVYTLPVTLQSLTVTNQEVLTQDRIALRFSFYVEYAIVSGETVIQHFDPAYLLYHVNQKMTVELKLAFRELIGGIVAEQLNTQWTDASFAPNIDVLNQMLNPMGLEVRRAMLLDVSFPKMIQELFAKQLEAKIRSQTDLENARTVVATARTLKNASEMVKGDEYVRFVQLLELLSKASEKGKHTFEVRFQDFIGK